MKKLLLIIIAIVPLFITGQNTDQNYIKSTVYKTPVTNSFSNPEAEDAEVNLTYFDGLGRPVQHVANKMSNTGKDIITHIGYDGFGRQANQYLPYVADQDAMEFDADAENSTENFYNTPEYQNTENPYSRQFFDASPLNRVVKKAAPGIDWKGNPDNDNDRTIKISYETNIGQDEVRHFDVAAGLLACLGNYSANELYKTITKNENWTSGQNNTVEEYTDNLGRTVLKRAFESNEKYDTYYVYDTVGNLSFVIPPLASGNIAPVTASQTAYVYNQNISLDSMMLTSNGSPFSGGGSMSVKIENSTLRLTFSGGWAGNAFFDTSKTFSINAKSPIPDMVVGNFDINYSGNSQYRIVIADNQLKFEDLTPATPPYAFNGFITQNLSQPLNPAIFQYSIIYTATVNQDIVEGLCYQYKYDSKYRLTDKKLPGKRWEYLVYDKLDRVVATGPAVSPINNTDLGWLITKYDALGRVAYTGWEPGDPASDTAREAFRNSYNAVTTGLFETVTPNTINSVTVNYSNTVLPDPDFELLNVNYYDDYSFPDAPIPAAPYILTAKGLQTGSWMRVLNGSATVTSETASVLYDDKFRPAKNVKHNLSGGLTEVMTDYDFTGRTVSTLTQHSRDGIATLEVHDHYSYTEQGRPLSHLHAIGGGDDELLSYNEYDPLGQLKNKKVGGQDITAAAYYQKVDYAYNIRGWLKGINDVMELQKTGEPLDLFAFKINYQDNDDHSPNEENVDKLYNGNISETYWRTSSDNVLRKYGYHYDALSRLNSAVYQKPGGSNPVTHSYDESRISYDANGNIMHLERTGEFDDGLHTLEMDRLNYFYAPDSNMLIKVTDVTNKPGGFKDDSDGTNDNTADYHYDANGNMTRDENKGITSISYNYLNLPVTVQFGTTKKIQYIYDAAGQKLGKIIRDGSNSHTTDYLDGFQYHDGVLDFFPTSEGYVKNTVINGDNHFNYVYNYTDHLGNIRLSYGFDPADQVLKIMEENNYYPFGLKHNNYNMSSKQYEKTQDEPIGIKESTEIARDHKYNYKYNSKEWQEELGLNAYDYGARMYMPDIGRWGSTDGKAELYFSSSPYAYASNTPVQALDPDGNLVIFINGMHGGSGGTSDYWRSYETVRYMTGTKIFMGFSYHTYGFYQRETGAFDTAVMNQLGDHNAMYRDGAIGGTSNVINQYGTIGSSINASDRIAGGYSQGQKDAKTIIENLARDKTTGEIVETIKIITHSMGGAYGKGYVNALKEYIKTLPKEQQAQIKITLVADFDPFQGGSLTADPTIPTLQYKHKNNGNILGMGWLANEDENGLPKENITTNSGTSTDHSVMTFLSDIKDLSSGTYKWDGKKWIKQ